MQKKTCTDCQKSITKLDNEEGFKFDLCLTCWVNRRLSEFEFDDDSPRSLYPLNLENNCKVCDKKLKRFSGAICKECQSDNRFNSNI